MNLVSGLASITMDFNRQFTMNEMKSRVFVWPGQYAPENKPAWFMRLNPNGKVRQNFDHPGDFEFS